MTPEITFAGRQSNGKRANQEDTYGFCLMETPPQPTLLLALADGMGGHERGEIASHAAALGFVQGLNLATGDLRQAMLTALNLANAKVRQENERAGGKADEMGTTFVALHIRHDQLRWVSVGDSPLYLFRQGVLTRLNEEHSAPVPGPPGTPPRPMLMSALTGGPIRMVDAPQAALPLLPNDVVICASDGINSVEHSRLQSKIESLTERTAGGIADAIIGLVEGERQERQDNVTVAIIKYLPALASGAPKEMENATVPA